MFRRNSSLNFQAIIFSCHGRDTHRALQDKDYILKVDKLTVSFDRWIYLPVKTAVNI